MSEQPAKFYGKYRGTVLDNIDPLQTGRLMVQVPDVSNILPVDLGDAVPAVRRHPVRVLRRARDRLGGVGRVRAGRPGLSDLDRLLLGIGGRGPRAGAGRAARRCSRSCIQTVSQNTLLISDTPGPTGGILLKSSTGALISMSDTGITISNGQGATITHDRPGGHRQRRRPGGDLSMPGFLHRSRARPSCARTAARRCRPCRTRPSRWTAARRAVIVATRGRSPAAPACRRRVPPCVTAQWVVGTTRVTSYGQPLVIQGGTAVCAPTGTPLLPVVTQMRVSAT